ncbi:N-formylglutamate deformylase [Paremcibacter congregatus]|uniref:N-formylglutamate deformylase n=1 Tax=Paremcibacter congregatus TaxID=2043170 RepID=UPI003A94F100
MTDRPDHFTPYHFTKGRGPILVSMPHVGLDLPEDIAATLTEEARKLTDTDWYVDRLYDFLGDLDCSVIKARYSRYVIDLNRGEAGQALYPGMSETELCPTTGFGTEPLYLEGQVPGPEEVARRKALYWQPYHDQIAAELARIRQEFGFAILWDAHSIQSHVPRFFDGRLPDLNLGTGNGVSCDPALAELLREIGEASDYSTILNGRFKGGYITRHYGDPAANIHAVQMETSQITYMDEAPDFTFQEVRAARLRPVLKDMMRQCKTFF